MNKVHIILTVSAVMIAVLDGGKSRSDNTLLTAGFNLRTQDAARHVSTSKSRSDDTLLTDGFNRRTTNTASDAPQSRSDDTFIVLTPKTNI